MTPDTRHLVVLRHAKSDRSQPQLPDPDRPLAPRGERALPPLREHLRRRSYPIALVLCSSSVRTVQTLEGIRNGLAEDVAVAVEDDLYAAGASALLGRLQAVPAAAPGVLLIGHNPGAEDLVNSLTGEGDPDALQRLAAKYPTGGLAHLTFTSSWEQLAWGTARLAEFVTPRTLA